MYWLYTLEVVEKAEDMSLVHHRADSDGLLY